MQRREIVFTIEEDGRMHFRVRGFKGRGCLQTVERLKQLGQVSAERPTAEFYRQSRLVTVDGRSGSRRR